MKVARFPLAGLGRTLVFIGLCGLLFAFPAKNLAPAEENPSDVIAAAKLWLSLIDAGQYEESYTAGSQLFRDSITETKWVLALKTLREPLGKVVSRKMTNHTYKPNGIPGLDSACVIINYDTSFTKADSETETVILKWENGRWLGVTYTLGPKPSEASDSDSYSPQDTTTTTTETHITPPPQQPKQQAPQPPPQLPLPQ